MHKDVDDFPIGARVQTPTGRRGTVVKHQGYESKFDDFVRVVIRYDGGGPRDLVTLQPGLLTRAPAEVPKPTQGRLFEDDKCPVEQ